MLAAPGQRPPLVIDADALHALARNPHAPTAASGSLAGLVRPADTLTPHPGEAAFLLGRANAEVQADRFGALADLRALAPAVWLLKGAGTLIAGGDGPVFIAPFAEPALAVGGSGDVLAGCLAALLGQIRHEPDAPRLAAGLAVLLHAGAGRLLGRRFPARGNTATDIADALPEARALFLSPSNPRSRLCCASLPD